MPIKYLPTEKKLLFDGQEEGFYTFKQAVQIPHEIIIYERDFRKNSVNDLAKVMAPDAFQQLCLEGAFVKNTTSLANYTGSDGLALNYFIINSRLFIFANGEYQPGRYKIYYEGMWQL